MPSRSQGTRLARASRIAPRFRAISSSELVCTPSFDPLDPCGRNGESDASSSARTTRDRYDLHRYDLHPRAFIASLASVTRCRADMRARGAPWVMVAAVAIAATAFTIGDVVEARRMAHW